MVLVYKVEDRHEGIQLGLLKCFKNRQKGLNKAFEFPPTNCTSAFRCAVTSQSEMLPFLHLFKDKPEGLMPVAFYIYLHVCLLNWNIKLAT